MPKRVDWADRVEAVREVAYEIAVEIGISGISLPAVAERLVMSPRTLQRLFASERARPHLALQRAERFERNRRLRRARLSTWATTPTATRGLTQVLETLPGQVDLPDRDVWWQLVLAHAGTDWVRAARATCDDEVATFATDALSDIVHVDARAREGIRLHALVLGAASLICDGRATYEQVDHIVRRHVAQVLAEQRASDEDAA